ncbi:hydroxyacylglutathione hydrolase [Glaciecola siphonariae]|uniref:Hydroxyacylglutathione hydrolase n=1 Tax=Glaciecola siphonariae TaxID=521012 RepID=A0ABV9LS02_9ALTE
MSQAIQITAIKAFTDNYIWCLHDGQSAVVVDPGDAEPVLDFLSSQNLHLSAILITHHHFDHTGGILNLQQAIPHLRVIGPYNEKIKGINEKVAQGDSVSLFDKTLALEVLETPGHTMDHIAFYNTQWLFCGDTLFSAGCGRMFEGTPEVFLSSLDKLSALNADTKIYCTHEYTLANLKFARELLPEHTALKDYEQWAKRQRAQDAITLPSSIDEQKRINPFLFCHDADFQSLMAEKLQQTLHGAVDTFAALRLAKDNF